MVAPEPPVVNGCTRSVRRGGGGQVSRKRLTCQDSATVSWSRLFSKNHLWTTGGTGEVIHGSLVAGATVTWSHPRRKTADHATATWSLKPIYKYLYLLTCSCGRFSVDNSIVEQGSEKKGRGIQEGDAIGPFILTEISQEERKGKGATLTALKGVLASVAFFWANTSESTHWLSVPADSNHARPLGEAANFNKALCVWHSTAKHVNSLKTLETATASWSR